MKLHQSMSHFLIFFFVTEIILLLCQSCCPKFQPDTVKKVSEPLKELISEYISRNNKCPDSSKFSDFVSSLGCQYSKSIYYKCNGYTYKISEVQISSNNKSEWIYEFYVRYKGTKCFYMFQKNGEFIYSCKQDKCFGDPF